MNLEDAATPARPNGGAGPPTIAPLPADDAETMAPRADETQPAVAPVQREHRLPIRAHPPELRARVRTLYEETDKPLAEISGVTGVGKTTISGWARQDHWIRAAGAPAARTEGGGRSGQGRHARLMGRLFRVYGRQLATLEKRAGTDGTTDEKDARTLAVLAKTLETLIALDRDDGAKATQPESVNRGDYRAELARHLSRWAEEGEEPDKTS
jgi:hypothetical protein